MRIGRARGKASKVAKLVRQIDEMDARAADLAAKAEQRKATESRPGAVYLPANVPGEVLATRPTGEYRAPSIGWQRAVCVDVFDEGVVETKYGPRHQVEFCWQLEECREDGNHFHVWRRFTLSLSDTSTLRKFLEVWQGYPFGVEELKRGVPLAHRFIGRDGLLLIEAVVNAETGKTYRNVRAGYPLPAKAPRVKAEGFYIRKAYRRKKKGEPDGGGTGSGTDRAGSGVVGDGGLVAPNRPARPAS